MQSLVYYYIMNIQKLKRLLEVRGEIECSELYQDMAEASLCDRTGDNFVSQYLTKGLFKMDDRGAYKAVEGF